MKGLWLVFFAFIIALTAAIVEVPVMNFSSDQMASVSTISDWETGKLYHQTNKFHENTYLIAEDFIPIVVLAEDQDPDQNFLYYLPLYYLSRQKEFFLLI